MFRRNCMWLVFMVTAALTISGGTAWAQEPSEPTPPVASPPDDAATATPPRSIEASDPDNCLLCHRFPGLARLDATSGDLRLFFVSERFQADGAGPHTRLACTGCHDRAAVEKIPHADVGSVDCSEACHLVTGSGSAVDFSHRGPTESLAKSVHDAATLAAQPYSEPLLRDGQSACLYCHDDPVYRMPAVADTFHRGVNPTVRCETCHDDSLPVDTSHYLRHVGSRLGDQRPAREAARTCAVCHSDPALNAKNGTHDAVTSYMRSFHGKASTLGLLDAPTCMDCHASEDGNPHLMLAAKDPQSTTYKDNQQLTCRSLGCHDNATPALSNAAVHMRVQRSDNTIEFWVTTGFILLIFFEMTLDFMVVVMESLNAAFRPLHKEHLQLTALAQAVQAHPIGRKRMSRLTVHERFQHWVLVGSFFLLVLSGLPMKFSDSEALGALVQQVGGLGNMRVAHRIAAAIISITFAYHVGYLVVCARSYYGRLRAEAPNRSSLAIAANVVWDWPLVIHPNDVLQYIQTIMYLFGLRKHRPLQGRYHFAQKFEYLAVFWGMAVIGLSGAMLWREDLASEYLGGRALNFAYIIHSYEAFLALIYVVVVHFFAVMFSPSVFPLNLGSLTGDMPPTELGEAHAGLLREVAKELGVATPEVEVPTGFVAVLRRLAMRAYALFQAVVLGGCGVFVLWFLIGQLSGPEQAIQVDEVPLRLDATTLTAASSDKVGEGGASHNELQRGPLAHFHAIPSWYEPDPGNSCTTSGCHSPLPHGERKEVRAFLNMHTTFIDCQTCHRDEDLHGTELGWLNLADRSRREPPAVLRLAALLETVHPNGQHPAAWDEQVIATLSDAVEESGSDPELKGWQTTLAASRVGGVRYESVIETMRARINRHGHGEYGTKIGIADDTGRRWKPDAEQQKAIDQIRGPGSEVSVDARKALVTTVHGNLKKPKVECSLCHTEDSGLLDFASLGYSPVRVEALRSNTIAKQAQAVESGETFFLPSVLGGPSGVDGSDELPLPSSEVQP